jgi:hypothetical protein
MPFGTQGVADLIASSNQNIIQFGERDLFDYIALFNDSEEAKFRDSADYLIEPTKERIAGYGGSSGMVMVETDEWGRVDPSRPTPGGNIGFPLRYYQVGWQGNRRWLENHKPAEMMAIAEDAARQNVQFRKNAIANALLGASNYSYIDHLTDRYTLSVKRLANADGFALPPNPFGTVFDGATHTHYLARVGTLAATDIDAVVNTVAEHWNTGRVTLLCNAADAPAIQALTGFVPLTPIEVRMPNTSITAVGNLDSSQDNDRLVGYWGTTRAAPVWVKSWVPPAYVIAIQVGNGTKALAYRTPLNGSGALRIAAANEQFPLRADTMEAEYGFGVQDRLTAAVLYIGGTSYVSYAA